MEEKLTVLDSSVEEGFPALAPVPMDETEYMFCLPCDIEEDGWVMVDTGMTLSCPANYRIVISTIQELRSDDTEPEDTEDGIINEAVVVGGGMSDRIKIWIHVRRDDKDQRSCNKGFKYACAKLFPQDVSLRTKITKKRARSVTADLDAAVVDLNNAS